MRPHIDFVQAQNLPWQPADNFGMPGAYAKVLSLDNQTEASSLILKIEAGSRISLKDRTDDLEFLVLEGAFTLAGRLYGPNCYGYFPAGHMLDALVSEKGCAVLWFRGGEDRSAESSAPAVPFIDISEGRWDGDFDQFNLGEMKDGAKMRVLRQDPVTGETTYVTATIAFRRGARAERHPISQEFFLLAGELAGELGVMQAGAYCIRPPMAKHGPYGSPSGALIFFRGIGGVQETFWEDANPFTFSPEHQPILPKELAPFGAPAPRVKRY